MNFTRISFVTNLTFSHRKCSVFVSKLPGGASQLTQTSQQVATLRGLQKLFCLICSDDFVIYFYLNLSSTSTKLLIYPNIILGYDFHAIMLPSLACTRRVRSRRLAGSNARIGADYLL